MSVAPILLSVLCTVHRPKGVHRVRGFMFLKNNMDGDDTDNMKMRLDCNLRTMLETKYNYSGAKQFSGQSALPENNSIAARFKIWLESMNEYVLECNAPYSYSSGLLLAVTQSTAREFNNA
eukprot:8051-Heterococcus_DN1.PRE.1